MKQHLFVTELISCTQFQDSYFSHRHGRAFCQYLLLNCTLHIPFWYQPPYSSKVKKIPPLTLIHIPFMLWKSHNIWYIHFLSFSSNEEKELDVSISTLAQPIGKY